MSIEGSTTIDSVFFDGRALDKVKTTSSGAAAAVDVAPGASCSVVMVLERCSRWGAPAGDDCDGGAGAGSTDNDSLSRVDLAELEERVAIALAPPAS